MAMSAPAGASIDPLDRAGAAVLALLDREGETSLPRLCKRLQLSRSELQRLLLVLGEPGGQIGGQALGLVRRRAQDGRVLVSLSDRGRALVGAHR